MDLNIKILTNPEELEFYKEEWINLEKKYEQNSDLSFEFIRIWLKHFYHVENDKFGYKKKLLILFIFSGNELVTIAPLIKLSRRKYKDLLNISYVEFIAQQFGVFTLDFIGRRLSDSETEYIFNWLKNKIRFDILRLGYLKNTLLSNGNKAHLHTIMPVLYISGIKHIEDLEKNHFSLNSRRNLRKRYRKFIENDGSVSIKKYKDLSRKEIQTIYDLSESKTYDNKKNIFRDSFIFAFLDEYYKSFDIHAIFLYLGMKPISFLLYKKKRESLDLMISSFDRDYQEFYPGNLIIWELLKNINFQIVKRICLGPGMGFYKKKFSNQTEKRYFHIDRGNSLMAFVKFYLEKKASNKLKKKLVSELDSFNNPAN